jgi:hypothetical protein
MAFSFQLRKAQIITIVVKSVILYDRMCNRMQYKKEAVAKVVILESYCRQLIHTNLYINPASHQTLLLHEIRVKLLTKENTLRIVQHRLFLLANTRIIQYPFLLWKKELPYQYL